jgi:hypothetical protein
MWGLVISLSIFFLIVILYSYPVLIFLLCSYCSQCILYIHTYISISHVLLHNVTLLTNNTSRIGK